MIIVYKIILTFMLLCMGVIVSYIINFYLVYHILIPNPENVAVNGNAQDKLFELFFEISSGTGYHPEPSWFYIKVVYALGLILGGIAAYKLIWKRKTA
ncbi:MAG: hypothetical protein ACK5AS_10050 [Bacteroidota bacterium]